MKVLETTDIILNPVIGSRVLWPAIYEFQKTHKHMPLPLALLVLPIALHRRSRKLIFNMNMVGGSINKAIGKKNKDSSALISGNDLFLGLQDRLEYTIPLTLSSLNIGVASGLFSMSEDKIQGFPCYYTALSKLPFELEANGQDDTDEKQKASTRLGAWFSHSTIETIYSSLKVTV